MANKLYEVTNSLQQDFISDLKNGNVSDVTDWIDGIIDSAVIYTSDCYEIMHELMVCDFDDYIANFGEVTNISGLAYFYLREYVYENFSISEFEEIVESYERYEEILDELEDIENDLKEDEEDRNFDEGDLENTKNELAGVLEVLNDFGFELEGVKESH